MHLTPLLPAGVHASGRHQTCLYRYGFGQTARHLSLPAQTCSVCMHGCVCVYVWLIMCVCVRVRVRVRVYLHTLVIVFMLVCERVCTCKHSSAEESRRSMLAKVHQATIPR